jgi:ribosomal protein S27AE
MYALRNKPQSEMTASPDKYPQKKFKDKACRYCGMVFSPKAPSHLYCSQDCADVSLSSAYLRRSYGMDYKQYRSMFESQKGVCKICQGEGFVMADHHKMRLVVDHCHETGVVRGLLCHNCNRALGLLQDSVTNLTNAVKYLEGATTIPQGSTLKRVEAPSP